MRYLPALLALCLVTSAWAQDETDLDGQIRKLYDTARSYLDSSWQNAEAEGIEAVRKALHLSPSPEWINEFYGVYVRLAAKVLAGYLSDSGRLKVGRRVRIEDFATETGDLPIRGNVLANELRTTLARIARVEVVEGEDEQATFVIEGKVGENVSVRLLRDGVVIDGRDVAMPFHALERTDFDSLYQKGLLRLNEGAYAEAAQLLRAAVNARPDSPQAWWRLGVALKATGQWRSALDAFHKVVTLAPDGSLARVARKDAASIRDRRVAELLAEAERLCGPENEHYASTLATLCEAAEFARPGPDLDRIVRTHLAVAGRHLARTIASSGTLTPETPLFVTPFETAGGRKTPETALVAQSLMGELVECGFSVTDLPEKADSAGAELAAVLGQTINLRIIERASGRLLFAPEPVYLPYAGQGVERKLSWAEPELELEVALLGEARVGGRVLAVAVTEGTVLRSGDRFQVHCRVNRRAYLYVVMHDSQGDFFPLFPNVRFRDKTISVPARLDPDVEYVLPATEQGEQFWELDFKAGIETLYVLASTEQLSCLEEMAAELLELGSGQRQEVGKRVRGLLGSAARGVSGICEGSGTVARLSDGQQVAARTQRVTGRGTVVRVISFRHE